MERYIGLDVHAASTTFAVIGESGKRLGSHVVETNGQALVEQLKTIPGKKHVCLEEGTQSAWLYEILSPHAEEVIVAMVSESRGQKNDERDAFHLAEQLRTGAIKTRVFKEVGEFKTLRELGRTHAMIVQDVVRIQNRIKALLRSRGVAVSGKSVYSEKGREEFLEKLPDASRGAAKTLYEQYDAVEEIRRQAEKDLVVEAHQHPMSRVLESCPGLGPMIVMRSASDWIRTKDGGWTRAEHGLNLNHHHTRKNTFKGAATTVLTQLETEPFHPDYQRLSAAGTKPNLDASISSRMPSRAVREGSGHSPHWLAVPMPIADA